MGSQNILGRQLTHRSPQFGGQPFCSSSPNTLEFVSTEWNSGVGALQCANLRDSLQYDSTSSTSPCMAAWTTPLHPLHKWRLGGMAKRANSRPWSTRSIQRDFAKRLPAPFVTTWNVIYDLVSVALCLSTLTFLHGLVKPPKLWNSRSWLAPCRIFKGKLQNGASQRFSPLRKLGAFGSEALTSYTAK